MHIFRSLSALLLLLAESIFLAAHKNIYCFPFLLFVAMLILSLSFSLSFFARIFCRARRNSFEKFPFLLRLPALRRCALYSLQLSLHFFSSVPFFQFFMHKYNHNFKTELFLFARPPTRSHFTRRRQWN
jgi:hypothetical protein